MSKAMTPRILGTALLCVMLNLPAALAAAPSEPIDLITDHPSSAYWALGVANDAFWATWGVASGLIAKVLPPSPTTLSKSAAAGQDQQELVKLLGYAGYKLKEIDSQIGVIPTLGFKFALVRELSEADWDYLDYHLEMSRFHTPGLGAAIQRAIVETVMTINTGADFQVSELKVQLLPLPKVAFSVTPKVSTLGEESSTLLRAIQKMEKRLRGEIAVASGKVLPNGAYRLWMQKRDWLIGCAIVLYLSSILVEIRRQLRPAGLGRSGPVMTLSLLGLGSLCWVAFTLMPLSLITLGGGIAMFGLTALMAVGKGATEPVPPSATEAPSEPTSSDSAIKPATV